MESLPTSLFSSICVRRNKALGTQRVVICGCNAISSSCASILICGLDDKSLLLFLLQYLRMSKSISAIFDLFFLSASPTQFTHSHHSDRMEMMRLLGFIATCLAIGRVSMADTFTNGLLQDNPINLPLRRQFSNSTSSVYELAETYDASNFWDKFEFIEVLTPRFHRPPELIIKLTNRIDYSDQRRSHSWLCLVSKP